MPNRKCKGLFHVFLALILVGCGTSNTSLPTEPPANDPDAPFRFFMGTLNGGDKVGKVMLIEREGQEFPVTIVGPDGKILDEFDADQSGSSRSCCFGTSGVYKATAIVEGEAYDQYVKVDASKVLAQPGAISLDQVSATSISVSWPLAPGAELYELVIHEVGDYGGRIYPTTNTSYTFFGDAFSQGRTYQVEVEAHAATPSMELTSQQLDVSRRESAPFTVP